MQVKLILGPWKWPLNQLVYYDSRPAAAADFLNLLQSYKDSALEIVSSFLVACVLYVVESM